MIPKKIHYCWFSKDPYTPLVKQCLDSWHQYMPDWEFVLWDYEKIKEIDSIWLKECISVRKWAFAADFVRLWAVYHEGGIYLDSDVRLFQSLEPFLNDRFFIGRENFAYATFFDGVQVYLTSHCFGAEAGHPFLAQNLAYYQDRHFITCSSFDIPDALRYDMLMMPYIQGQIAVSFGYKLSPKAPERQSLTHGIEIYPSHYFCWIPGLPENEQYAQHLGQGSWRSPEYHERFKPLSYTFRYKLRWRIVWLLSRIAERFDYRMYRIHPDGRI